MKALVFSDLHWHIWERFNENNRRTRIQKDVVTYLFKTAYTEKVPIFFAGDIAQQPEELSNAWLSEILPFLNDLFKLYPIQFIAISGNHDMAERNTRLYRSPSYIQTFSQIFSENFINLDFDSISFKDFVVHGVPYINNNQDYGSILDDIELVEDKVNILMNHTDYAGQKDVGDFIVGKGENIDEEKLRKFNLVWTGHIHRPGKVRPHIYCIGSPMQLRVSDADYEFGYWILKDNFTFQFRPIDFTPKFRTYKHESEKINDTDFWIKESIPATPTEMKEVTFNINNKHEVLKAYFKATGNKNIKKFQFLSNLIE